MPKFSINNAEVVAKYLINVIDKTTKQQNTRKMTMQNR